MLAALARVCCVLCVALVTFVVTTRTINGYGPALHDPALAASLAEYAPMPHRIPSREGGVAFRFAMAHDILHERYPRSGPAYHRERIRLTRQKLTKLDPNTPQALSLTDDLAAAHARLGEHDEAVALLRVKLARRKMLGHEGPSLSTTLSHLGASLTRGAFTKAAEGDPAARGRYREGVEALRAACVGHESWRLTVAEFLLAAMEKPERLQTFDCLGNWLGLGFESMVRGEHHHFGLAYGHAARTFPYGNEWPGLLAEAAAKGTGPDDPALWPELRDFRREVTKVGAEGGWKELPVPSHRKPVPFDEAMLGLVGLWHQDGPEAHLALAIGETMLRVGQRRIAWAAYARASRLADSFASAPDARGIFPSHWAGRQHQIEQLLRGEHSSLESNFKDELAHGEAYQREYQAYEAERIAAGASIDDPAFYDAFHAGREPVASPSGPEEWFAYVRYGREAEAAGRRVLAWALLAAGAAALLTAALIRRWWPRPATPAIDTPLPVITAPASDGEGHIQKSP